MESTKNQCIGIYGFPKTGSTWLRVIIGDLLQTQAQVPEWCPDIYWEADIRSSKPLFDADNHQLNFYKSHSKRLTVAYRGQPLHTDKIIYIVRHPLDVFCSQLNYLLRVAPGDWSLPKKYLPEDVSAAKESGMITDFYSAFMLFGTLQPYFFDAGSWSENYLYWLSGKSDTPTCVIRYEDLYFNFEQEVNKICNFLNLHFPSNLEEIRNLIDTKKTVDGGRFYWRKKPNNHIEFLTNDQIENFYRYYSEIIHLSGYDRKE
ncbi:sulfotransferase domain-containing protein [Desulfobacter postgatei]|uniref:Citrate synthase n=1 Tax=Desulfobacter postgatei 2ac9 TaxID=879212 RepID=I5B5W3_9BACT|nr:sulfotransferase domain-containing protein [Desulfobacter postgatei]EIM64876.1 citrate synthase [Desulfobacter postgatei 2ac9]